MLTIDSPIAVEDAADFVIVGSGAAGATCAHWLSDAGKSVIVLEEGGPAFTARGNGLEALNHMYRDGGASAALGSDPLPLLQGMCVGGGTVINCAIQIRFPEWVWQEWVNQDPKWQKLLPWKALMEANDWVDRELKVAATPPELLGGNGGTMLRAFGADAHPIRRSTPGCKGSGNCMQGVCEHGAKQSLDLNFIPSAIRKGARVYARCKVEKVEIKHGKAQGIIGKFASGKTIKVKANQAVILAASAVQTPGILLKSGISLKGNGFMCHPGSAMAGLFNHPTHGMPEASQSVESLQWCKENIKFESLGMPSAFRAARVPGVGRLLAKRLEMLDQVAIWGVACKAEARGKVMNTPLGTMVRYSPTIHDRRNLLRGLSMMAERMLQAGALEVWPAVYGMPEVIKTVEDARKIALMKPDPGTLTMAATHLFCGVEVGEKFQVAGIQGLVVADSSMFPSNIGVNPMSAIMSAAILVSKAWTD